VTLGAFNDRVRYFALVFGGLSVIATVIARRSWQQFQDALKTPLTLYTGDVRTEPVARKRAHRAWWVRRRFLNSASGQGERRTRRLNHSLRATHFRVLQIVKFAVGRRKNGTS
jgi:hypothetical protein